MTDKFVITDKNGVEYLVRRPSMDDLDGILAYITELVNERALISMDHVPSRDEEEGWLKDKIQSVKDGQVIYWLVEKDGKILGSAEADRGAMKQKHTVEIGIALLKEIRGRGIGQQLMRRLLSEITTKWPDIKIIYLSVLSNNEPAKRLYEKLGFRPVARLPNWNYHFGEYIDEEIWYWHNER